VGFDVSIHPSAAESTWCRGKPAARRVLNAVDERADTVRVHARPRDLLHALPDGQCPPRRTATPATSDPYDEEYADAGDRDLGC
jgi:hypothetical protein